MLAHHISSTHFPTGPAPSSTVSTSTKRRKPTLTYRAPKSVQKVIAPTQAPSTSRSRPPSSSQISSSAPSPLSKWSHTPEEQPSFPSSSRSSSSSFTDREVTPRLRDRHSSSFLPLYHPFGPLALSLPPLDPIALGLPISPRLAEALEDSARSRKQGDRAFPDVDPTARRRSEPVEVVPEKSNPRKRRTNGSSGGGASKRRRKETTDGDAAYPAKRTRSNKAQSSVLDVDPESAEAMAIRPSSSGSEDASSNLSGAVAAPDTTPEEVARSTVARRLLDLESGSDAALNALSHQAEQGLASLMSNLDQALDKLVSASPESR